MYLNFYGLNKEPFGITPDPAFLFLSHSHKEALAAVMYGVEKRKGFVVITGEVGVGKTTILRSFLEQSARERLKTVYLFNTNVTFPVLLKTICRELAIPVVTDDPDETLRQLHQFLIQEYQRGCNTVLVIDEAQNMPLETLENIRMLSNLETSTEKLLQIVFSGQPEFDKLLNRHELRQLKQRIAVRSTIAPLSTKESAAYINYRLAKAGNKDTVFFTPGALKRILCQARGIPRLLNILCDNALITAFGYHKKQVNRIIAGEIIRDFTGKKEPRHRTWWISVATLLLISSTLGLVRFVTLPVVNRTAEKNPVNLPIQPIKYRIEHPDRVTETPPTADKGTAPVTRVVKAGDSLAKLVEDVYGERDPRLIALVKQQNCGIKDIDRIEVGDKITFPSIKKEVGGGN
jgi:general secretion pathway protein A